MPPKVALILCIVLVVGLLRIERQRNPAASLALWVPTFWMLIVGSRPVGRWFESTSSVSDAAGSPLDRLVLSILILLALWVLSRRKIEWSRVVKDNFWLILLYLYLGLSILWSDFPFVSLKRWIRALGAIPMGLVIFSSQEPLKALESVFRRTAYVLIPFSLMLAKYFPRLGVDYGRWSGELMWVGVATHKNSLGQISALSAFFLIWALLREWRSGNLLKTGSQSFADALVLAIAVLLLTGTGVSYSATAIGVFIIGIAMLLTLNRSETIARSTAANLKAFMVTIVLIYLVIGDLIKPMFLSIFSRSETLTGRTEIWSMLGDIATRNPLLGVGYGGFWLSVVGNEVSSMYGVTQSHNGYLEVYLELGIVGIVFLSAFLLAFCGKVRKQINHEFDWGVYGICFLSISLLYNYTETGFIQSSSYLWVTIIYLSVVFSAPCLHTKGD